MEAFLELAWPHMARGAKGKLGVVMLWLILLSVSANILGFDDRSRKYKSIVSEPPNADQNAVQNSTDISKLPMAPDGADVNELILHLKNATKAPKDLDAIRDALLALPALAEKWPSAKIVLPKTVFTANPAGLAKQLGV